MAWAWGATTVATARWVALESAYPYRQDPVWRLFGYAAASDDGPIAGWSSSDIVGVVVIGRLVFVIASASGVVPMGAGLRPQSTQDVLRFRSVGIYAPQNTTALPVRADTSSSASSSYYFCCLDRGLVSTEPDS